MLNDDPIKEGVHVYALFSSQDDLIMYGDLVFGLYTSKWPTIDDFKTFTYTHINMRDNTKEIHYNLITNHSFDAPKPAMELQ